MQNKNRLIDLYNKASHDVKMIDSNIEKFIKDIKKIQIKISKFEAMKSVRIRELKKIADELEKLDKKNVS